MLTFPLTANNPRAVLTVLFEKEILGNPVTFLVEVIGTQVSSLSSSCRGEWLDDGTAIEDDPGDYESKITGILKTKLGIQ